MNHIEKCNAGEVPDVNDETSDVLIEGVGTIHDESLILDTLTRRIAIKLSEWAESDDRARVTFDDLSACERALETMLDDILFGDLLYECDRRMQDVKLKCEDVFGVWGEFDQENMPPIDLHGALMALDRIENALGDLESALTPPEKDDTTPDLMED